MNAHTSTGALLLAAALLTPSAAAPQAKRYAITSMDVTLAVQPDGAYRVAERIAYLFEGGRFTYAYRDIPLRYIGTFALDSVAFEGRRLESVELKRENRLANIRWSFPPKEGPAEFTLAYTARGALFEAGRRDIVDWDAVGREWRVPISQLHVAVLLPASLAPDGASIRAPLGSVSRTPEGWRIDYRYALLPARTAYRVIVDVPRVLAGRDDWPGGEKHIAGVPRPRPPLPANYGWLIPLLALAGLVPGIWLFGQWRSPKREAEGTGAPPTTLPRAATMLPETSGGPARAFAAVLFDLAARGHLQLRRSMKGRGIFKQPTVEPSIRTEGNDSLTPFEERFLAELSRHPTLGEFATRGGRYRRQEVRALRRQAVAEGLLEEHGRRSALLLVVAILGQATGLVLIVISAMRATAWGYGPLAWGVLLAAVCSGLFLPGLLVRTVTDSGALLRAQIRAHMAGIRRQVEEALPVSPGEAARLYMANLPWLTLDPHVTQRWVRKLASALKRTDDELPTPGWALDATGAQVGGSVAYQAFMPYYHVTTAAAGAASPGSGAGGSAGAGAGGGAGGGGGGAG